MGKRDFMISTRYADLDQKERDLVIREFRSGSSRVLGFNWFACPWNLCAAGVARNQV